MKRFLYGMMSILILLLMVVGTGCSRNVTVTGENGEKSNIKLDNGGMTITNDQGQTTITTEGKDQGKIVMKDDKGNEVTMVASEDKIPDDFPKDIPFIEESKLTSSLTTSSDGQTSYVIIYESEKPIADIAKLYSDYLMKAGYEQNEGFAAENIKSISGKRGEEALEVTVTKEADAKIAQVLVSYHKPNK
ncbi:hypothetical protein E0485_23315 [Paenibacillus albiflavus]|uniref:Lipoprotein n=1 Tax=Paenibacillus albiflavus TaxID=2545760 RepID=A0A4V2WMN2_9BACL|nr:hypothetical protein [Paenibacillus albiflavus]TCZ70202.1 hypothetical protein E0485_23315 [Paenibacillus albiflavus]